MEKSATNPQQIIYCPSCWTPITPNDAFCHRCGCSINASEKEQKRHTLSRAYKEIDLVKARKKIRHAGDALFWIAGLTFLSSLWVYNQSEDYDYKLVQLIINLIFSAINAGLGIWAQKQPLPAILSGLSLFVLLLIANAFADPADIMNNILYKAIVIVLFINGIRSVINAEKLKKELNI